MKSHQNHAHPCAAAALLQASKDSVVQQINEGKKLINASSGETFALIIDGKSLTYALEDDAKAMFLDLAIGCGSVICCRSSPKQKALVSSTASHISHFGWQRKVFGFFRSKLSFSFGGVGY
jgi:hypothetical protein